jgi:predicted PhzF superfamily epimerase YddE/YHI9
MRYYLIDTFADAGHLGNPAAVVPLPALPDGGLMQDAAHRIGVPTTAFVARIAPGEYRVRWFTPFAEINLCGHATIGSARHLFAQAENAGRGRLRFVSGHGMLYAQKVRDLIALDLPKAALTNCDPPPGLLEALGVEQAVNCAVSSDDVLVELASAGAVTAVSPDFAALARQPFRGHIVTAPGAPGIDFVSRAFFPALGVDEDEVCVTAHCKLTPFWSRRLGRQSLTALQLSQRGGRLEVEDGPDSVRVLGSAVPRGGARELELDQSLRA